MQNANKPLMLLVEEIAADLKNTNTTKLLIDSSKYNKFPYKVLSYLSRYDNESFKKIIQHVSLDNSSYYSYNDEEVFIPRLFLPKTQYYSLHGKDLTRWVSDNSFMVDKKEQFISTQWVGHDVEKKNNLRINDFALALYKCTNGKYFVNFKFINNKYSCQLMEITDKTVTSDSLLTESSSLSDIIVLIESTGLIYSPTLIKRFAFALMTKPFVILSGLAGSGKTQLALAFAKVLCENVDKQLCFVPVGADWTNREPLLGYPNALKDKAYVMPDSGVLQLLMDADEDPTRPYFLILDEMNLSYVERYFADFLSAMEAKGMKMKLWDVEGEKVPKGIALPRNVFIIGTINVDETTYMFSPKVLDRANVIEFKVEKDEMKKFLMTAPVVTPDAANGKASNMAEDFVKIATTPVNADTSGINDILIDFFEPLKKVNAEFGYRSASEIARFVTLATANDDLSMTEAVDAAIVQKLLPKLHGSRKKLEEVLKTMWLLCMNNNNVTLEQKYYNPSLVEDVKYKLSADKILRMYKTVIDNGFTSFAEA